MLVRNHIAANFPMLAARIAAEGEDVVMGFDKGKATGKAKAKGKGKFDAGAPTKTAWGKRHPGHVLTPKAIPILAQWQQQRDAA